MHRYNRHPIYGIGMSGPDKKWYGRGLIYDSEDEVTEIQRLECPEITFATKKKAEEHALELCKTWINEQKSASESTSPAPAASVL